MRTVLWPTRRQLRARLPRLVVGLVVIALGIALMARAGTGLPPYEVLHQGIARRTPLTLGQASILLGLLVLVLWIPLRQVPGLGTVLNVVGVGLATDAFLAVLPEADGVLERTVFTVVGVTVIGIGIGLYIGAGLGPGPRDGLMTGLAARGMPVWAARLGLESSALVGGLLLGGTVGLGTVLFAVAVPFLAHGTLRVFTVSEPAPAPGRAVTGTGR
ncbi:hypothetical protein E9549_05240 [Blastococcus sp. MG754426]|nr:hypothetical protein [Blastococcus sp. MG754426]MCF6511612.1 hypothetical protein [Blastococcus sp. MG754427]